MYIDKILIHPDWKTYTERYDADIAILYFEKEVMYSNYIRPVCLPPKEWKTQNLRNGVIVGWGLSEKSNYTGPEKIPSKAYLKVKASNEECFFETGALLQISSPRTFCAGGENTGPCNGDSGRLDVFFYNLT